MKWINISYVCSICQETKEDTKTILRSSITRPLDELIEASAANHERGVKEALLELRLVNNYLQSEIVKF